MKKAICLVFYLVSIQAQEKKFYFKRPFRFTRDDEDEDDNDDDDDENNP